jgi:hypothetical protein
MVVNERDVTSTACRRSHVNALPAARSPFVVVITILKTLVKDI